MLLIVAAHDDATLLQRKEIARRWLACYFSAPAYALALHFYGLENLCADSAAAIKCQSRGKMIGDELLDEFVGFAPYDQLAIKIEQRYSGRVDRIEVSIPIVYLADKKLLD